MQMTTSCRRAALALFLVAAPASLHPCRADVILPSSALAPGRNGAFFRTNVRILNPGPAAATVVPVLRDQVTGETVTGAELTVPPRQQLAFDNALETLFGRVAPSFGPIRFRTSSPGLVVSSSAENVNACGAGAVNGQWLPGLDPSHALRAGVLAQLAVSANPGAGWRTNVVFVNPGEAEAMVTARVRRGDGSLLAEAQLRLPGQDGFLQRALDDPGAFPGVAGTTDANLWLEFASSEPLLAFASVIRNDSGDPFAVVAVDDPGAEGMDTDTPFPLDRVGHPGEPTSYKGLPLGLVDNGTPEVTPVRGAIGVVCVGMSNATQECRAFLQRLSAGGSAEVNPEVRVVDCAVGNHAIERWNEPAYDAVLWDACKATKLPAAGLSPDQVRVLYHKAANQFGAPVYYPEPGSDYSSFRDGLSTFSKRVRAEFPSVQAVYTSSRSYGGFSTRPERGEPLSYEEGHALNGWLAANPSVDGAWYGWGPYLWAPDCATGLTNGTGYCYVAGDYQADAIHPAAGALDKIATMIHARFLREAWYRRAPGVPPTAR
jgi:hypothetical protein